jgi:serine/threonine protein kinase
MNSLQKPCNYYDKYMKYKTKYIEYKNKLIVVNGKKREGRSRCVLNGGGYNANIYFYTDIELRNQVKGIKDIKDITNKKSLYIKIVSILPICVYQVIEKVGEGTTGTVFKIKKIVLLPAQSEPEMFVIKLTAGILPGESNQNTLEGLRIDSLPVLPRVKALFQGNTERVDFAIFNYLGQDLDNFLHDNSNTITAPIILSLIKQLHEQLSSLNKSGNFHNDVKMSNIVVQPKSPTYELSLIDYGHCTDKSSNSGTTISMCIHGCALYILEYEIPEIYSTPIQTLLTKAVSSDYVGFFNIIICLLSPSNSAYQIYLLILNLKGDYSLDYLLKVLCLLCYVSNSAECDEFLAMPICKEIVGKIDTKLEGTKIHMTLFTSFISDSGREITVHMNRRLSYLCFIYSKIISNYETDNVKFVDISKLPKFLLDISCCLDLQFNLEQFNENFGSIFNEKLLEPVPEPAQPVPEQAQPTGQ